MEVSVVSRPVGSAVPEVAPLRNELARSVLYKRWRVAFPGARRGRLDLRRSRKVAAIHAVPPSKVAGDTQKKASRGRRQAIRRPQLFVGLPLDAISEGNRLNHAKAIAAGLKALKLLGADGVELPIWWGIVEKEAMGKYDWSAYLEIAQMIRDAGLQIHASLYFHSSKAPAIPLPAWLTSIGETNPDIYFTDKAGRRHKECLSLAIDDLPVLGGKTPIQIFEGFFQSFQDSFTDFMSSTITNIAIGLGAGGELRYPSLATVKNQKVVGVGEFQCYDKYMLALLKKHAEESGNHYWGLSGPHDAPGCDQTPQSGNFFKEQGGSWETPYGDFFQSWYSEQLMSHGEGILSAANAAFSKYPLTISARVPFMHSWYKTRSHPLESTTGYYNSDGRDGYDAVARMFAKNNCKMIVTGMDLTDETQRSASRASPESLLSQIMTACTRHGVHVCGENSSVSAAGFNKIKLNILDEKSRGKPFIDSFVYQRMGASFFSPEHWPRFTEFVRSIGRPELHADDLLSDEEEPLSFTVDSVKDGSRQMQAV